MNANKREFGMIVMAAVMAAALSILAGDGVAVFTEADGIEIRRCHPTDEVLVHVVPWPMTTNRCEGWFKTRLAVVTLKELSMLPAGTNRLEFWTICRGQTSPVPRVVTVDIRRPPPAPEAWVRTLAADPIQPPLPPGMTLPLPGGVNSDYAEGRQKR